MTNQIHMTPELEKKLEDEIQLRLKDAQILSDYSFVPIDFSEKSIQILDEACDNIGYDMPGGKNEENIKKYIFSFGVYLGEVFRHNFGGHWEYWQDEYGKTLAFVSPKGGAIFPLSKMEKRLTKGKEENLFEYYQTMKNLYFSV